MTNKIKILDDSTINKIAAGEVVERPSSVVKELIENSIDANSTNITIEIKNGGKKYIRITDDGDGINPDDIQLAFLRHSTSKIKGSDDLSNIISLGFRGEALASISSVSMIELITKTKENDVGKHIEINGGILKQEEDVGAPKGTTLIVKNLFYNTPVRKRFLNSDGAEAASIGDIINKLSLCYPEISFKYIKDGKYILKTPGNGNIKSTVYSVFGKEYTKSLIPISYENHWIKINGLISKPSFTRGNRNHEFFFINNRYVNSIKLSRAIEEGYSSLVTINRYPIVLLYFELDPEFVDVNVHPTKLEVRFDNENKIKNILKQLIKNSLLNNNLIPKVDISNNKGKKDEKQNTFIDIVDTAKNISNKNEHNNNMLFTEEEKTRDAIDIDEPFVSENDFSSNHSDVLNVKENNFRYKKDTENTTDTFPELEIIGRIFSTYVIAEEIGNNNMYMIDQHAAHERIMYEKFRNQYRKDNVVTQSLLSNKIIDLSSNEFDTLQDNFDIFEKLGFDIENFGQNTILIRGVPMIFGKPDSGNMILDILDNISEGIDNNYDLKVEKIMKMACTNAIKAGDYLGNLEIKQLVKDLKSCDNPFTCPHGRPITIKITKYELEKKFKRIQ